MQVGDLIAFISYTMQIAFSFMMMAVAGAVMGIVVVMRRPVELEDEPEPAGPLEP
jgi:hypothetical protein